MKIEEDADFEKALEIDMAVWNVLPKIEARTIQELLSLGHGIEALHKALDFKLRAELYSHTVSPVREDAFTLDVHDCPWVKHIKKAGRGHFSSGYHRQYARQNTAPSPPSSAKAFHWTTSMATAHNTEVAVLSFK